MFAEIPEIEIDIQSLNNQRAKEAANALANKLATSLGVSFRNVTAQEAMNILKDRVIGYKGEPAFYFAGTVYIVGDNINMHTVLHEFSHPLLQAIRRDNPELFAKLYDQLAGTGEGEGIKEYVKKNYPELAEDSDLFKEEVLAFALQLKAVNKATGQPETQGFIDFIKNLLYSIKQALKKAFNIKQGVEDINVDTTIEKLAEKLLGEEFDLKIPKVTAQDVEMFARFNIESVKQLTENASVKSINEIVNRLYQADLEIISKAESFVGDKASQKIIRESIFNQGTTELAKGIKKSLRGYQTVTTAQQATVEEKINNALEAEKRRIEDLNNKSVSLVTSLGLTDEMLKNIVNELTLLQKGNYTNPHKVAVINLFKGIARRLYQTTSDIDQVLKKDFSFDTSNPLAQMLNEITRNAIRAEELVREMSKEITTSKLVEITGYMTQFVEDEMKSDLGNILKNILSEQELNEFIDKIIDQQVTDADINAVIAKDPTGKIESKYINKFIGRYNQYILNAPKIRAVLEGKTRDVSPVSRFLESYSSSNNPVIGGISTWIEEQKTEAEQRVWKRAMDFKVQLETLLPAVGFNKSNTRQLLDMLTFEDEVVGYNRKTGAIERKTVYSFLNAHGNGWRYELDSREFAVFEARRNGDEAALKAAETELRNFKRNYMYDEYVAEYYEKDDIFEKYPLGNEAWLDRKLALDSFNAEQNKLHNETERFENYSQVQEAWRKYQQLYSLRYEDGTMKTGNDLEKAKILIEYRNATRDYYEFVPIKGSLQTAYNEFVNLKKAQGLSKEELDTEVKKWIKQNTKILYSEEYYKDKSRLLGRLRELQNKINESANTTFNPSDAFDEVFDLINSYRDEQGQPMATLLSKDKLGRIKQLQQEINNYRQSVDKKTGLSNELLAELNAFIKRHKQGETLSEEEQKRYLYLSDLSSESGLSAYELAEFDNILSELGNLSTKIPTDYYMDELNFNLSKHNIKAKTEDEVDEYINTEEFRELVKSDDNFFEWFKLNHVNKKVYVKGKGLVTKQERTFANSVSIPKDSSHIVTTEIIDSETGKPIIIKGVPNSRHSFFKVKDKYRTIPFGLTKEEKAKYIGTVIDNKGNYLPRPHNPGQKNSAVDGKFVNKRYMDLKAANNAEFRLLEAVTKFHLETQDGKSSYSKLYMDMPRFAIKGVVEAFQAGKYGEKAGQIKESISEWWKQKFGKSVEDAENGFNYNAENNLVNTDLNGDEITYIPVQGLYKLDPKATNPDVMENILKYALSVEEQSQLYKTLPLIETMLDTLADKDAQPKNMEAYSRNLKAVFNELRNPNKKFGTNNLLGQLQSLIQREYYGVKNSDVSEQYPKLTKFLGTLQGLSAQASLAVNLPSDFKNQYAGYVQLIIEAAGAEFVNMKDLAVGRGFSFKTMLNWSSFGSRGVYAVGPGDLNVQLVEIFDPAFRTQDNFGRSISRHIWKDLVNGEWKYMHRKFGELEVALTLFGSMLNAEKVEQKLPDGTVKVLHYQDAWEKGPDGIVKLKAGIHPGWSNQAVKHTFQAGEKLTDIAKRYGVTVEEIKRANGIKDEVDLNDEQEITIANSEKFKQFKRKVQGLSRALFGAYDEMGQPEGNKYLMYRMFFFMRKWFTPMFVNRFGIDMDKENNPYGERYDWALGRTRKGFYIQAFQTLLEGMKTMGKSFKYMSKKEKAALRKAAAEGTAIIMFSLLASMIFGYDDDDEEKWKKIRERSGVIGSDEFNTWGFMQNHMLALMMGLQAETSAFVPLPKIAGVNLGADDYAGLLTSTTTAFGNTLLLYLEILSDVFNLVTFNDLSVYKKEAGPYSWEEKDDYKIVNHLMRTFGFTGSSGDPETMVKNLRNSSSRIGR
jgi:LysM repeat protein